MLRPRCPPCPAPFPYTTLFRSSRSGPSARLRCHHPRPTACGGGKGGHLGADRIRGPHDRLRLLRLRDPGEGPGPADGRGIRDRESDRLRSVPADRASGDRHRPATVTGHLRRGRLGEGGSGGGPAGKKDEDDESDERREESPQPPPARRPTLLLGDGIADDGEDDADEQGAEAEAGAECERVHVISSRAFAWSDDDVAAVFTVGGDGLSRPW